MKKRTVKIKLHQYQQLQKQLRQSIHRANEYKALYCAVCKRHSVTQSQLIDVLNEKVKKIETHE